MTGKNFYNPSSMSNPGPGQYCNEKVNIVFNKEPSWRLGTSTREDVIKKVKREGFPGPGNYTIPHRGLEGKKYAFGKEKRNDQGKNYNPGPGQYHIPCQFDDVPKYQTYGTGFNPEFRFI